MATHRLIHHILTLTILCCMGISAAHAQDYLYVNAKNLIVRDRPEKLYMVMAILQPGAEVEIAKLDRAYLDNKAVKDKFCNVTVHYYLREQMLAYHYTGWAERRYLVDERSKIKSKVTSIVADSVLELIPQPYTCNRDYYPEEYNAWQYPPPLYKGGELVKQLKPMERCYHTGPRGGCYYKSGKGTKVYVDKQYCH